MSHAPRRWVIPLVLSLSAAAGAAELSINGIEHASTDLGTSVDFVITGAPGAPVTLFVDVDPGPTDAFGQSLPLGFTQSLLVVSLGAMPATGELAFPANVPLSEPLAGLEVFLLALVQDSNAPQGLDFSNGASLRIGAGREQLAGNGIATYPFFEYVRTFNQGSAIQVALDPSVHPVIIGDTADVYVVPAMSDAQWDANPALVDATGDGADTFTLVSGSVAANIVTVDSGTLNGDGGATLGVGYDVVIDFNQNGVYDVGDFLDGYGPEAGLYVVDNFVAQGPYAVTEILYSGGQFLGQNTFYPTNIASLGELPLVVISHGNGHNYQWYDHLGEHLASNGYVVMSHQNNTQPGTLTASTTTLTNTDYFLGNLATINGGVLDGHVDDTRITWIGHSRGGEGVVRAYHRLVIDDFTPANYDESNIRLVSSIAPVDFGGTVETDPHDVIYHLWTGGADADVNGCAQSNSAQTFHLHDRAAGHRQSISLHGVGHADFHNGTGGSVATGPCLVGRANTHRIMKGYLLPMLEYHIRDNPAGKDFLFRQWEALQPLGSPTTVCVVVDLMYREAPDSGKFIIDDFQQNVTVGVSSSGGVVVPPTGTRENRMDDLNTNFTDNSNDQFNSVTLARQTDTSRGAVFEYNGVDESFGFEVVPEGRDMRDFGYLSFRAAQASRDPFTTAVLGDVTFEVTLRDGKGITSTINIGAYGGGIEEPYQRTGCGIGAGWAAEFETVRMRISDFTRDGSGIDLSDVVEVQLDFGPSHGSNECRIVFDELELTND